MSRRKTEWERANTPGEKGQPTVKGGLIQKPTTSFSRKGGEKKDIGGGRGGRAYLTNKRKISNQETSQGRNRRKSFLGQRGTEEKGG